MYRPPGLSLAKQIWIELVKDRSAAWPALLLAALAGTTFAFWLLGWSYIIGTSPSWLYPESDTVQHVIGWLQFIKDDWRFPLFYTSTLYYPEGINIILTDSLALMSLFSKLVYKGSGIIINPFSYWMLICFILQPVTAVLLARALKVRSLFENALVIILSMSLLTFLMRAGTTVMAQFTILFSLYFYVRAANEKFNPKLWAAEILMLLLTMLMHLYLWGMTFPIFAVAILQAVRHKHIRASIGILFFIGTIVVTLVWMWACGLLNANMTSLAIGGFDSFSMNLLSPFVPPPTTTLFSYPFRHLTFDATGGQVEGYNYLGTGTLLLLAFLLLRRPEAVIITARNHWPIFALMTLFFIYALSNRIFLGHYQLLSYHVPHAVMLFTNSFRASGRFFWPPMYSLLLFGVAACFLWLPRKTALPLVTIALALNFIELSGYRDSVQHLRDANVPRPLDEEVWENLARGHDKVFQYPSFDCGGLTGQKPWPENYADYQISLTASRAGVPVNSTSSARPFKDCGREKSDMTAGKIDDKTLYIFSPLQGRLDNLVAFGFDPHTCRDFTRGVVCSQRFLTDTTLQNIEDFQPVRARALSPNEQNKVAIDKINAALADAAAHPAQKTAIVFDNIAFFSQFGERRDNIWYTPANHSGSGYFLYGPYVTMPPGHYTFEMDYALKARKDMVTLDIVAATGNIHLGSTTLAATYGQDSATPVFGKVILTFDIPASTPLLETRIFSSGGNDLAVRSVLLIREAESAKEVVP